MSLQVIYLIHRKLKTAVFAQNRPIDHLKNKINNIRLGTRSLSLGDFFFMS